MGAPTRRQPFEGEALDAKAPGTDPAHAVRDRATDATAADATPAWLAPHRWIPAYALAVAALACCQAAAALVTLQPSFVVIGVLAAFTAVLMAMRSPLALQVYTGLALAICGIALWDWLAPGNAHPLREAQAMSGPMLLCGFFTVRDGLRARRPQRAPNAR